MRYLRLFIFCFIASPLVMLGQTKYVKPGGNDSNNGSTQNLAWLTIQHAMDSAKAGDTVIILAGNYNEALQLNVSGTSAQWISFRGISADSVFVDGSGLNADNLLLIDSQQFIRVENIHFYKNIHNYAVGILVQHTAHDITIANCKISEINFSTNAADSANSNTNANPLLVYGNSLTATKAIVIDDNEIYNCRTGYSEALSLDGFVDGFEIKHNRVHDISNIGIDMAGHYGVAPNPANDQAQNGICSGNLVYNCVSPYADAGGIYADGSLNNIIEGNIIHDCQYGIEVGCETPGTTASGIIVRSNFVYNNLTAGIAFGGYNYPTGSGKISHCKLYNNSCFHNDTHNNGNGELAISYSENCSIKNNILYCNARHRLMYCQTGNLVADTFDYNCWYSTGGASSVLIDYGGNSYNAFTAYTSATGQDAHSIFSDPVFVASDTLFPNLDIQSNSPCINAGDNNTGPDAGLYDITGNPRVQSGRIDMGAYEFIPANDIRDIESDRIYYQLNIYPNPAKDYVMVKTDPNATGGMLELTDVTGRLVFKSQITNSEFRIPTSALSGAVYFVRVSSSNGRSAVKKLIIE